MIGQILPNNNEKCYRNFSQNFLASQQAHSSDAHLFFLFGKKQRIVYYQVYCTKLGNEKTSHAHLFFPFRKEAKNRIWIFYLPMSPHCCANSDDAVRTCQTVFFLKNHSLNYHLKSRLSKKTLFYIWCHFLSKIYSSNYLFWLAIIQNKWYLYLDITN
jgi:hypothetical protein